MARVARSTSSISSRAVAAALGGALLAGPIDEDAAHRFGCGGEKVAQAVLALRRAGGGIRAPQEPEIRLMHQGRRLERLSGFLLGGVPELHSGKTKGKRGDRSRLGVLRSILGGLEKEAGFTKTKVVVRGATRPRPLRVKGGLHDSV